MTKVKHKIQVFGPGFSEVCLAIHPTNDVELEGLMVWASTVEDALAQYAEELRSAITPYDGSLDWLPLVNGEDPRCFFLETDSDERLPRALRNTKVVIDVHIERNGHNICAKQNLAFELQDGDVLKIDMPAC